MTLKTCETIVQNYFDWRAPLSGSWHHDWLSLKAMLSNVSLEREPAPVTLTNEAIDHYCLSIRRLASQQLGTQEQLRLEQLAKAALRGGVLQKFRPIRLGLLSNRTMSYLISPLLAAGLSRGLLLKAYEAPFDTAALFTLSAQNPFPEDLDAVVIALDEAAFNREGALLDQESERRDVHAAHQYLLQTRDAARKKLNCPTIVATQPDLANRLGSGDAMNPGSTSRFINRLNVMIADGAANGDWICWDLSSLAARVGSELWFDPGQFFVAKTNFRIELAPLIADHLSSVVAAMSGEAGRAIVLDLDNTLWGGVIGDDGLSGIRLGQNSAEGEAYATFQKFILELKRRGVVVTVCSKNNDEIAREPFKTHPDMVLREDDIAVFQSNWNDKATNIKAIGDKLGLGLKSLVFIDDNPAERERVRQELPLVAVPEIGDDPTQFVSRICKSGVFDHVLLNVDDLGRALSYEARAKAAEICAVVGNYEEYLASLRMKMTIARFDKIGRPRITQLISKSNQFNLTTLRLNEEQVRAIEEDPSRMCWQVRLDDRFSTHGIIAIVIVHKSQSEWRIESWLQSCRILERGVEQTLMNEIMRAAAGAAVTRVVGTYIPTDRNAMVEQFYPKLGFTRGSDGVDEAGVQYECNPSGYRTLPSFMEVLHL